MTSTAAKRFDSHRRTLGGLFLALALLTLVAALNRGDLPPRSTLRPELSHLPDQKESDRAPFDFEYRGHTVNVQPVAAYQLHGLVVSHNNIASIADIYHDSTSVDTKDLCVIWGANLERDDYLRVKYWSGPWTCYAQWRDGVVFAGDALSNNHLITSAPALRRQLAGVRVGDQIRFRGLLVNYRVDDWGEYWRRSSTDRTDGGDGACEVVYFEDLQVLARGTPGWYAAYDLGRLGLLLSVLLWVASFWFDARHSAAAARREPVLEGPPPEVWTGEVGERPY